MTQNLKDVDSSLDIHDHMNGIILTTLMPGEGIGNTLRLGHSMFEIVNHLTKFGYKLVIGYSDKSPLETPVTVIIKTFGIRLLFDSSGSQSLILIEMMNFENIRVLYKGACLNNIEIGLSEVTSACETTLAGNYIAPKVSLTKKVTLPTLKVIYNLVFGPTYPGKLSNGGKSYSLSYPGILFRFAIKLSSLIEHISGSENNIFSKLLNWDNQDDIELESITVFRGNSWNEFHKVLLLRIANPGHTKIEKLKINLKIGEIKIVFTSGAQATLILGETTQQTVLKYLGPLQDCFNKFDSRLLIHNHLSKTMNISDSESGSGPVWKFHNYYEYGLDFLYDLNDHLASRNTGVLKKVIIHNGNLTESMDFMKWGRCNWEIKIGDFFIDSNMYFLEVQIIMNKVKPSSESLRPIHLNRNETVFIENELDIINYDDLGNFTLSQQGILSQSPKLKTWGQSKLYGCDRCICEVLDSNGCISGVTIY